MINLGKVNDNITLPTSLDSEGTFISYSSKNTEVLTDTGEFTRPYKEETIIFNVLITKNTKEKTATFEILTEGFKPLVNIASGYVYTKVDSITNELYQTLDIINCAFTKIDANLNYDSKSKLTTFKDTIIPKAHKEGCYCLLSIEPHSSWADLTNPSNNKLNQFTDKLIEIVNTYGFDGIDIDWEVPKKGEEQWFTLLMENLYQKIKQNNENHLLTAAIGGGKWQPPMYDLANSKHYIDYINIMLYDMSSENGQYQNALYPSKVQNDKQNKVGYTLVSCSASETVEFFTTNYGIEKNKLLIGIPFYGRKQVLQENGWKSDSAPSFDTITNTYLANPTSYTYVFDEVCKVPYIISKEGKEFISYENELSISYKASFIKDNNLGGLMYWQNGQDTSGALLKAIKDNLKN